MGYYTLSQYNRNQDLKIFQSQNLNKKKRKYDLLGVNTSYYGNPKRMNYKEWNDVEKIGNIYENKDLLT